MTMYVITHKEFNYPLPKGYLPVLVGAEKNIGPKAYIHDNVGDNISERNLTYCELTGLYWLWKNSNTNNIGISHYRRYFSTKRSYPSLYLNTLLTGKQLPVSIDKLDEMLKTNNWIVATPEKVQEGSIKKHFEHCHNLEDLLITRDVVREKYPRFLSDFDDFIEQDESSFYNMFYTSRKEFDRYSQWLFDILFEVEKRVDISGYNSYQKRLFGFLGERLLNVWLFHLKGNVKYLTVYNSDQTNRIWAAKEIKHKVLKWR